MILTLMGAGDEPETSIKVKLWPVLMLVVGAVVFLFLQHSNHEARICVAEKQQQVEAGERSEIKDIVEKQQQTIEKMHREQNLFFSLREPKWNDWKAWDEKRRKVDGK